MLPAPSQLIPGFDTSTENHAKGSRQKSGRDPNWHAFTFETGYVALHVPTSTVFATEQAVYEHIQGYKTSPEVAAELQEYAASFKVVPRQTPEVSIKAVSLHMA